jgi:hypothetical protein
MLEMLKVQLSGNGMKFAHVNIRKWVQLDGNPKDVPCG